ncbi:hypothetical protein CMO91_03820 [Candidatus Woesearchaeota archaeon]|nr:hypothetical protein [Candidatus Woesearchaeota archaeon]
MVIHARQVAKAYGTTKVFDNLSFRIRKGEFVSIIGTSGCGKTTLLRMIGGLLSPTAGKIDMGTHTCGFVFQQPVLLPWKTIQDNIQLPKELGKSVSAVEDMLSLVKLDHVKDKLPHQLSGGMQQRVNLARALITNPGILLMDEPFSSLDEITREKMQDELIRIWQQSKNTVAFVTHSISEAVYLSDRVLVLSSKGLEEVDVPLARPRTSKMKQTKLFHTTVDRLQRVLGGRHA